MKVFSDVPSGISTRPVFLTLPTSEKTFVPELFGLPVSVNQAGPRITMGAMLYQVSTLLMLVGLPHRPFCAGKGGRGRGRPACAFEGRNQRCFFAAYKRSGAFHHRDVELESTPKDVLPEHSIFPRLFDRAIQAMHGQRILRTHINDALALRRSRSRR